MAEEYLKQFWVTYWNSQWEESKPVVEDIFGCLNVLEDILKDVPSTSHKRLSLMHAKVEFLINHLEGDWRAIAKWLHQQGKCVFIFLLSVVPGLCR